MFVFGEFKTQEFDAELASSILTTAQAKRSIFASVPIESIINVLGKAGKLWNKAGRYQTLAKEILKREGHLSDEMIEMSLEVIPNILSVAELNQRLLAEFGSLEILDRYTKQQHFEGRTKAFPLGVLLHVSAGNVFLGAIDSLIMGLITKNINILKLSSNSSELPMLFAKSIIEADTEAILAHSFCIVSWRGGTQAIENQFKEKTQAILAWGGLDMVTSYRNNLMSGIKLIDFGPKISIQVITKEGINTHGIKATAQAIAQDIAIYDGQACSSPQNCFIESGINIKDLLQETAQALTNYPVPRAKLSEDEFVEINKEKARGQWSRVLENGSDASGNDYYLHYDTKPFLRPSPQNRTLIFKNFIDINNLVEQLEPFAYYLQSCSYQVAQFERDALQNALGLIGMKRFAPLGTIMQGMTGAPHDGTYALRELVFIVGDEAPDSINYFLAKAQANVPYYNRVLLGNNNPVLQDFPLLNGAIVAKNSLPKSRDLLNPEYRDGYIFSSGGTSGAPKFSFYSHAEFSNAVEAIVPCFTENGVKPGTIVANLFAAGNLWSSFLVIDKALERSKAISLPMGGLGEIANIVSCLQTFLPEVVCGLPSLIIKYATYCQERQINLCIPKIFYAGEHLNQVARKYLARVWGTTSFHSAGYASVDAGPIGWQCPHCLEGEHHLIEKHVTLEIINEEAVVTSRLRNSMPIIRYQTGDRVVLLNEDKPCPCGSTEQKFVLLGRLDDLINIWSSRVTLSDLEKSLTESDLLPPIWQVELETKEIENNYIEQMTISLEGMPLSENMQEKFLLRLFKNCKDLANTQNFQDIKKLLFLKRVEAGSIPRVSRTGKIKRVVDKR